MKKLYWFLLIMFFIQACTSTKDLQDLEIQKQTLVDSVAVLNHLNDDIRSELDDILALNQKTLNSKTEREAELLKELENNKMLQQNLEQEIVKYKNVINKVELQMAALESVKSVPVKNQSDTVKEIFIPEIKQGNVSIFCPRKMVYQKTYDIFGMVSEQIKKEIIKEQIKDRITNHEGDTTVKLIVGENLIFKDIEFIKDVEITLLKEVSKGFDIVQIHDSSRQSYSENMESWHWKVKPTVPDSELALFFRVRTYDEEGNIVYKKDKTFKVRIKVKSGKFWTNTKLLIIENPKWAITTLLLPFLTFLWGRYQERRKRKKKQGDKI